MDKVDSLKTKVEDQPRSFSNWEAANKFLKHQSTQRYGGQSHGRILKSGSETQRNTDELIAEESLICLGGMFCANSF
jgi:hypothetical protein